LLNLCFVKDLSTLACLGRVIPIRFLLLANVALACCAGAQSGKPASGLTYAVTPTVVSHLSESNSRAAQWSSPWQFYFHLADPATSGNAIIVACRFEGNATLSITDNESDTYKNAEVYYVSANNQSIVIAESFNVTGGAYNLTATWSANTEQFQCVSTQIAGVTAADGPGTGNEGSGTSVTAGSMTPTVKGDLVYQVTASLSGTLAQSGFTSGSGLTLLSADLRDGMAVQAGVSSSTSAIDPTMTLGTNATWISAAVLLKFGTAGGVPTGMRVAYEIHENIPYTIGAGGSNSGLPNPMALQIPCAAAATIAAMMDGGGGSGGSWISTITDSNGNTWSQIGLYEDVDGNIAQAYYAPNVRCPGNAETLTLTFNTDTADNTIVFYIIPGASTNPLDTYSGGAQNMTSDSSTITTNYTLTPATSNELIIGEENWAFNTAIGVTGTNQLFDSGYYSGMSLDGPQPIDQNGGWMHYYANSTSPVSFTYNLLSSTDPNGPSVGMAVAFIAAPLNPVPSTQISTKASGLVYSRVSQTFNGTVTIENISSGVINGPFQILFTGLPPSVTLVNATGNFSGAPYLTVPTITSLGYSQSTTVNVQFKNPSNALINCTPVIYSGSFN
jgi:hypothetical protein